MFSRKKMDTIVRCEGSRYIRIFVTFHFLRGEAQTLKQRCCRIALGIQYVWRTRVNARAFVTEELDILTGSFQSFNLSIFQ